LKIEPVDKISTDFILLFVEYRESVFVLIQLLGTVRMPLLSVAMLIVWLCPNTFCKLAVIELVNNDDAEGTFGAAAGCGAVMFADGAVLADVLVGTLGAQCASCGTPRSSARLADKPKVAGKDFAQNLPKM